jgi:2-desacetyl-2-hydroxyethyl bacteriochlorophyllide A dehydrogenase
MQTQKLWIRKFGGPQNLSLEESKQQSSLRPNEVRIDVHYSGINFADIIMRMGLYKDAPPKPFVPGYEVSGVISQVGAEVKNFRAGDRVCAGTIFGGYTSELVIPENFAIPMPQELSMEEAAALPVAFITAYAALFDMGRVRAGDKVLIDCATGGVGTLALQMLRHVGAQTVGLTSAAHKKQLIESYGAKAMTHEEFWKSREDRFDFVLNSEGGSSIKKHYNRLAPTGRIVCIGFSAGIKTGGRDYIALLKTVISMPRFNVIGMFDKNRGVYALNALKLMEDEKYLAYIVEKFRQVGPMGLRPHVGKIVPFQDAPSAHQMLEERKTTGKVLLSWR